MRQEIKKAFKGQSLSQVVTPSEDDSQSQNKKLPTEFQEAVFDFVDSFQHSLDKYYRVVRVGAKYNLDEKAVQLIIRPYLLKSMTKRQVWYLFSRPQEIQRFRANKIENSSSRSDDHVEIDDNNQLEESYNDEDEDKITGENLPVTETVDLGYLHTASRQLSIDEFLSKEADGETKFYFENISINMAKTELLTRKGLQTFRRLYFEI